jgi:cysteine desulfurase
MSTNPRIYLDYNATMPMVSAAREAVVAALDQGLGNPSSVHADGRRARDVVERARDKVAALMHRPREQIVFTSGGTEANELGLLGLAAVVEKRGGPRIVASDAIDHPSLLGAVAALVARGWEHRPVAGLSAPPSAGLVALSAVNHELGTIPDLAGRIADARAVGAWVHVDAVQLAGKRVVDIAADSIAISAHKIGGPQGVGALAISVDDGLPLVDAGHQERERRGGTENTLGIAGFGAAAAAVDLSAWPRIVQLGARLEAGLVALGARINGSGERIGGTINAAFHGIRGESIVIALDLAGISCSTGAACTSGSIQPSKVLLALGQSPDEAREAVRFSLGTPTTAAEIDAVLGALPPILDRARRR